VRLATRRLIVRPLTLADVSAVYELGSREDVALPGGFPRRTSLARARRDVRFMIRESKKSGLCRLSFSIVVKPSGRRIGGITLRWPHAGVGEIGYALHPDYWGRGYAAEAARKLVDAAFLRFGAHRVQATCWVKNARSSKVLRKLGLRLEGRLRGYLKRGGVVRDEFMWGITREDWLRSKRPRKTRAGARN
jgi:RimJ/RimL family protein N-acetyltransferase